VIDVANRVAEANPIAPAWSGPQGDPVPFIMTAVAPDANLALTTFKIPGQVAIIDVPNRACKWNTIPVSAVNDVVTFVAITPDGKLALAASLTASAVAVIDLSSTTAEAKAIPVNAPLVIAITPDGSLALVTSFQSSTVTVIDIAGRTAETATIPVLEDPCGIAISPNGALALVTSMDAAALTIIDIPSRTARTMPSSAAAGFCPSISFTPDGGTVLLTNMGAGHVAFL
jgi:YVTN family beta-propeller protein